MVKTQILVVEDEQSIRDMLQFSLQTAGFKVISAPDCITAEKFIFQQIPHLILLDWMLPGIPGIEFAKSLKRNPKTQEIPLIMLTAKAEENHKIKGLELGMDDYITKPFSPRELIARIKAVLRRSNLLSPEDLIQVEDLKLNTATHQVSIADKSIKLTTIEYRLLYFLLTHPKRVYSREQLLDHVWGCEKYIDARTVDVHILRLRNRLKPYGYARLVETVRGVGYQLSTKTS